MRNARALLALPSTLLVLISTCTAQDATKHHLESRYDGQNVAHDALRKRELLVEQQLQWQQPVGIRKMTDDPGEKLWLHYWEFGEQPSPFGDFTDTASGGGIDDLLNSTTPPHRPFALHGEQRSRLSRLFERQLITRDGTCPTNTTACTSIGHADSCCTTGDQCILVTDTGNGPVGCCAPGQSCGNTIGICDPTQGYTPCPNSTNKGCCIPGYTCSDNICVNVGSQTVTATSTTLTSTSTSTTSPSQSPSVVVVTSINVSGFTTTATVTTTFPASTVTVLVTPSSGSASAPVRPTSSDSSQVVVPASASSSTLTTTSSSTTADASGCPTGYYMCSAVYLGGCCQVDRDCHTASCPATATTTVINGSPTVIAPAGASSNAGTCATGWYSCAASVGGGCCPNGYSCGQTDCPATVSGVAAQSKQAPSEANVLACAFSFFALSAAAVGIGMIVF